MLSLPTRHAAVVVIACGGLCAARVAVADEVPPPSGGGAIVGRARVAGPVSPPQPLAASHDAHACGGEVPDESLLATADGGLANVIVVLQGVPSANAKPPVTTAATPRLDQQRCRFTPHVQAVPLGSTLTIESSDPVLHNVHAYLGKRTAFNLAMPVAQRPVARRLDEAGILRIRCDSGHTWMSAYIAVVPHRYFAVTAADGSFRIPAIPPGSYKLRAWHERLGAVEQQVTVGASGDATTSLTFPLPTTAPPPQPQPPQSAPAAATAEAPLHDALAITRSDVQELAAKQRADERARFYREGRPLFVKYCATCHGRGGDGSGPSAQFTTTPPRDLTRGTVKFRMTAAGAPATFDDLVRTISVGVRFTHMPAWQGRLSQRDIAALARFVMSLGDAYWSDAPAAPTIVIPPEPAFDATSIARGQTLYARMQCATCHGQRGAGDGPAVKGLRDDWGRPVKPADFTSGQIKGGCCGAPIFRAITTGLAGTPMPSFGSAMTDAERWDLAHYVLSLGKRRPAVDYLFRDPAGRIGP